MLNGKIVVIGDSHVNFFGGSEKINFLPFNGLQTSGGGGVSTTENMIENFTTYYLGSVLAYNFNKYDSKTMGREKIEKLLELKIIEKGETILFALGEIDIRAHIYKETERQNRSVEEIINNILDNYLEFLKTLTHDYNVWVWGPIGSQRGGMPTNPDYIQYGSEEERNRATLIFNAKLKERAEKLGIKFFSIAKDMIDENLHTKKELLADEIHLSQRAWQYAIPLFKQENIDIVFKEKWWNKNVTGNIQTSDIELFSAASIIKTDWGNKFILNMREHLKVFDTNVNFINAQNLVLPKDAYNAAAAYCFSDNNDMSFENYLAENNIPVFFRKNKVLPNDNQILKQLAVNLTLESAEKSENDLTLKNIVSATGYERSGNLILRLDMNTFEYDILAELSADFLQKFRVISIKLHRLLDLSLGDKIFFVLDKLNVTHSLVYIRAIKDVVVAIRGGKLLPDELEATYVLKSDYKCFKSKRFFPTELDTGYPSVNLGYWG